MTPLLLQENTDLFAVEAHKKNPHLKVFNDSDKYGSSDSLIASSTRYLNELNGLPIDSILHSMELNQKNALSLIGETLYKHVSTIDPNSCEPGSEDSFYACDLGEVYRQFVKWKCFLPRVTPFYAVKCNPNPNVLSLLAQLGTGFDCASKAEMDMILNKGIDPNRIIYAHPCKINSYLRYANIKGVHNMTFDNSDELFKIKKFFPTARLFLRITTDDSTAQCQLSVKYGAAISDTSNLLGLAKELDLNVVGVSFHVGSGASDYNGWIKAIVDSRKVFNEGKELGFDMSCLDIGGGFVDGTFAKTCSVISPLLNSYFPEEENIAIIAEPGRYFVSGAFTMASHVIAKRRFDDDKSCMIYLNDGVYGNMNCILFDHQVPVAKVLTYNNQFVYSKEVNHQPHSESGYTCSIWGPTCDGLDCISKSCKLTYPVEIGDWLFFENMGAYTSAATTQFNGFNSDIDVKYVCSESEAEKFIKNL